MYSSRIVLNQQQIDAINLKNVRRIETGLIDLTDAEMSIAPEQLEMLLQPDNLGSEPLYDKDGILCTDIFYEDLKTKIAASLSCDIQDVRCAVAVENSFIRAYPTMAGCYRADEINELDRFAVSILKIGEPVLIYCETQDGIWCYIRTVQTSGWILRNTLALEPDVYRWQQYCENREQVVVTDSRQILSYVNGNGIQRQQLLLMGTRLSLYDVTRNSFLIGLPVKDKRGNLATLQIMIPRDGSTVPGLMPLSEQNIVAQAKKMLGEPYGWGGTGFYRDCTSLICDIYSVFGLQFPRDSQEHMQMFGVEDCTVDYEEKYQFIRSLMPGSILYFPGHGAIYFGEEHGQMKMLHSSYAIGLPAKDSLIIHKTRRVVEGDLMQYRIDGKTFFDALIAVWSPERQKIFLKS